MVFKKDSRFETLLGFFYANSKKLLAMWLAVVVSASFLSSFSDKLMTFKEYRYAMNPVEIMFIGVIDAMFMVIRLFVPVLLALAALKYLVIKWKGAGIDRLFRPSFKRQVLISFLLSAMFSVVFWADVSYMSGNTGRLWGVTFDVFALFFASILFAMTSMYGLVRGFSSIIAKGAK